MLEFIQPILSIISGLWSGATVREKVFFFALVGVLGISSVWIPVQGCTIGHLEKKLAGTIRENQVLKKEKEVQKLSTERQKLLLDLYQESQANKAHLQSGSRATSKIRGLLLKIEQLDKGITRIEAEKKAEVRKIRGMTPEQQIEYIKRKSKGWSQ